MNPNLSDWDDDLPPEPEEAYQDLLRALKRKSGFGLFFVQCTPVEADKFIVKLPQEIPQKKIAVLRFVEAIDNLYQPVAEFVKDKQIDILLIKGLEYSLYKYEKRSFGEITEGQFSNLTSVPHILNHLNQQRERFRDDFPISFVFLLRSFSINYFIHRAPDFFDWRSGVFELPTTPEVVEQESNRLLREGNYDKYLKLTHQQKIERVIEFQDLLREKHQTDNRKVNLLFELGNLLSATKEYEAAITFRSQALKIKADDHEAWNNQGYALFKLGRNEEAIAAFDQALKIKADNHETWNNRGIALGYLKRYEEEIASYDKAIEIKPDYQDAWYHRGIGLKDLGKWKEALASWKKAIEIQPNDDSSWDWQGNALNNLGQSEEGIICYDQAIALNPKHPHAWYNRGITLGNLGRYEEAITSYDQALKIQPDDYESWYLRGNALSNLVRYEEAIASYDQALKCKPDDYTAWYSRGGALIKLGRWREGNHSISKAIEINPSFGKALLDIQKKHIISWFQQKLCLKKLVQIWISFLRLIGFRR
ncbi:tetratricopeptide repeat protein [Nostoc sp. KVJ3]|uniref:tetratricopeptide repeat protein n=1 Tax=Nostoc sp. KVJ3 TaxID=457945 RepID=UPI002237936A|nr:tetratricopeptide repeat protein [Nostoc sp. KVJ3]MCW5317412.1 tetratricopeptide repeat protein [Nostoc sp. KVJ3]